VALLAAAFEEVPDKANGTIRERFNLTARCPRILGKSMTLIGSTIGAEFQPQNAIISCLPSLVKGFPNVAGKILNRILGSLRPCSNLQSQARDITIRMVPPNEIFRGLNFILVLLPQSPHPPYHAVMIPPRKHPFVFQ